jgi:peptidoglycan/LPS O-acetylase OafA/YrhL
MEPRSASPNSDAPSTLGADSAESHVVPKHFPSLDGLRGAAVIAVFIFHYGAGGASANPMLQRIGALAKAGWAGVTLFFLLSGFLITGILWDSRGEEHWWRNFYVRRILRIFPLYYGSLILVLLAGAIGGQLRAELAYIWIPALFLQNFPHLSDMERGFHPLGLLHYWSLAVEEQFYLLWPLLLFLMKNRKQAAFLCLSVFVLSLTFRVAMCAVTLYPESYSGLLLSRAGELALGGWLALMYRGSQWETLRRALPFAGVASGIVVIAVAWHEGTFQLNGSWQNTLGLCAMTILLGTVLARSLQPGVLQRLASAAWLRWIGRISFGIYIFHLLFVRMYTSIALHLVGTGSRSTFMGVRWLVAAIGSVTIAWLSFNFYETPFLRLKRRFSIHTS